MSSIQELSVGKRKIDNRSVLDCGRRSRGVEDMTDEKYVVYGDHLAGGVKWR